MSELACAAAHDEPAPARFGLLCASHYGRVERALNGDTSTDDLTFRLDWPAYSRIVIEHDGRLVTPEVEGSPVGFESVVPSLVMVKDAINSIERFLLSLTVAGGHLQSWVSRIEWVDDAIAFTQASNGFRRNHPVSERDRLLHPTRWRCPNEHCRVVNPDPELLVIAPRVQGDGVSERSVQCAFCGHVLSMGEALRLAEEEKWRHEHAGELEVTT